MLSNTLALMWTVEYYTHDHLSFLWTQRCHVQCRWWRGLSKKETGTIWDGASWEHKTTIWDYRLVSLGPWGFSSFLGMLILLFQPAKMEYFGRPGCRRHWWLKMSSKPGTRSRLRTTGSSAQRRATERSWGLWKQPICWSVIISSCHLFSNQRIAFLCWWKYFAHTRMHRFSARIFNVVFQSPSLFIFWNWCLWGYRSMAHIMGPSSSKLRSHWTVDFECCQRHYAVDVNGSIL